MVAPGSDDGSLSLTLPAQTVNRGDHGNSRAQFSCAVDWIQDKTSDVHNVTVACELIVHFVCVLILLWLSLRNSQDMQHKRVCVCVFTYISVVTETLLLPSPTTRKKKK